MKIERLGTKTMFLVPSIKVYGRKYSKSGQAVYRTIHEFLLGNFGGYTCASGNIYGFFTSEHAEYDELREFRCALNPANQESLDKLQEFLAALADDIGEECIYLECDNSTYLVYP
jgi:hypothetical protein